MEASGVLFNMYLDRQKGIVDEAGHLVVGKGFSLQPNTAASAGRRAEIDQERPVIVPCLFEGSLDISSPLHRHAYTSRNV